MPWSSDNKPFGKKNPAWKGGLVTDYDWMYRKYVVEKKSSIKIARECNRSKNTVLRWLKIHNIPTRSIKESMKYRRFEGENNPNWRGGTPCEKCRERRSYNSKICWNCHIDTCRGNLVAIVRVYSSTHWRPRVFERDNYTCMRCMKSPGGSLNAHHIRSFAFIINDIVENWHLPLDTSEERLAAAKVIRESDELNDISNGVTLCEECHKAIHKGKRAEYTYI